MNTIISPSKPKMLSCVVAVALASLAGGAGADPVGGTWQASSNDSAIFSDGRFEFVHTYGFSPFQNQNTFSGSARSTWTAHITNDTDGAKDYQFSFDVEEGEIGISGAGFAASLSFDIRRDGASLSSNTTTVDGKGCRRESTGALTDATTCDPDDPLAEVAGTRLSVDLGSLAAGESFELEYELIATVSGLSGGSGSSNSCHGDTLGFLVSNTSNALTTLGNACLGWALVRSGDLLLPGTPSPSIDSRTTDLAGDELVSVARSALVDQDQPPFLALAQTPTIPEPGSLALAGAALMGLAGWRLRRGSGWVARG